MDPAIRARFSPEPGLTFLDTATYGLPPDSTVRVMRDALDAWQAGTASWAIDWDPAAERARNAFATLVAVPSDRVAIIPAASVGAGLVAAALTERDEVVVPADEFTSVLFPLLVARERGVTVREVPFEGLVDAIRPSTTLVATSLVQMQTGRVAPIADVVARARAVGARVLLDSTQGTPFVDLSGVIDRIDHLVLAGYKHILCPRGTAFWVVGSDEVERVPPLLANWRAADEPYGRFFGGPLTLGAGAARFDVSTAWFSWLGAAESLELLVGWRDAGAFAEPLRLARDLADGLGIAWGGSTLVCPPIADPDAARAILRDHRITAAFRGTAVRLSTHVYNDDADIDRAVRALGPIVAR